MKTQSNNGYSSRPQGLLGNTSGSEENVREDLEEKKKERKKHTNK